MANSQNYERVDGEIAIKGIQYKYVKRRFYNDSVELLCIPNLAKTGVQNARDDFFRLANDLATNNTSSKKSTDHTHLTKFSVQDFTDDHAFVWQYSAGDLSNAWYNTIVADVRAEFLSRLDRPPQA
jgi:hypothetical protein